METLKNRLFAKGFMCIFVVFSIASSQYFEELKAAERYGFEFRAIDIIKNTASMFLFFLAVFCLFIYLTKFITHKLNRKKSNILKNPSLPKITMIGLVIFSIALGVWRIEWLEKYNALNITRSYMKNVAVADLRMNTIAAVIVCEVVFLILFLLYFSVFSALKKAFFASKDNKSAVKIRRHL